MDLDEPQPNARDPLTDLVRHDLDRLSVTELEARIAALHGEIARARTRLERAVNHRASAAALFRS